MQDSERRNKERRTIRRRSGKGALTNRIGADERRHLVAASCPTGSEIPCSLAFMSKMRGESQGKGGGGLCFETGASYANFDSGRRR